MDLNRANQGLGTLQAATFGAVESAWGQHPSGPDSVCAGCSGNVRALCDRGSEPSFATDVRAASLEESESHSAKAGQADLKL